MVAFCSTVQKFHGLFCVGSLDSQHTVSRFQKESVLLKVRRENKILYINEEMGATTVDSQ